MLDLYKKRYPYGFSREDVLRGFKNFEKADAEPDTLCLLQKKWDIIKSELTKLYMH